MTYGFGVSLVLNQKKYWSMENKRQFENFLGLMKTNIGLISLQINLKKASMKLKA